MNNTELKKYKSEVKKLSEKNKRLILAIEEIKSRLQQESGEVWEMEIKICDRAIANNLTTPKTI